MPPPIQILAKRLIDIRGVEYFIHLEALRGYVRALSDIDFLSEMSRVDNPDILFVLWSVGLTARQQEMAIMRWKELTK